MAQEGGAGQVRAQKLKGRLTAFEPGAGPTDEGREQKLADFTLTPSQSTRSKTTTPTTRGRPVTAPTPATTRQTTRASSKTTTKSEDNSSDRADEDSSSQERGAPVDAPHSQVPHYSHSRPATGPQDPGEIPHSAGPEVETDNPPPVVQPSTPPTAIQPWETADLEIFSLLQQQVQNNRTRTADFIKVNSTLGLQQRGSEYEDLHTLLSRVAPNLTRFLPRFYPDQLIETHSHPLPSTQATPSSQNTVNVGANTPPQESPTDLEPQNTALDPTPEPIHIQLSQELSAALAASFSRSAEFMVVGRIRGKCPGPRRLHQWALSRLHRSYKSLAMRAHNHFEVQFSQEEGRKQTLTDRTFTCDSQVITFTAWSPYFNYKTLANEEKVKIPLWAQIIDLPLALRTKPFLQEVIGHIAEVLLIDDTDSYQTRLSSPRVRILTENVSKLPKTISINRHDGGGEAAFTLEYSRFPTQCERCRSFEHLVSKCPLHRRPVEERILDKSKRSKETTGLHSQEKTTQTNQPSSSRPTTGTATRIETRTIWQPITNEPVKTATQTPLSGRKGYRTMRIRMALWEALKCNWIAYGTTTAAVIVPVIYRATKTKDVFEAIQNVVIPYNRLITSFYLSHDSVTRHWIDLEAQQLLVNETMLHLCDHIKLKRPHENPLQRWTDAHWVYIWHRISATSAINTWLVLIKYDETTFTMKHKNAYKWTKIPWTLNDRFPWTVAQAPKQSHWEIESTERTYFLGPNPPLQLPCDTGRPWMIEEDGPRSLVLTAGSPELHTTYMAEPSEASDESYIPLDTPAEVNSTDAEATESADPANGSQGFMEPLLELSDDG